MLFDILHFKQARTRDQKSRFLLLSILSPCEDKMTLFVHLTSQSDDLLCRINTMTNTMAYQVNLVCGVGNTTDLQSLAVHDIQIHVCIGTHFICAWSV